MQDTIMNSLVTKSFPKSSTPVAGLDHLVIQSAHPVDNLQK